EKELPILPESDQHVALDTLLWVLENDEVESTSSNNIKKETYTPYRVLGNLSISGKSLIIDCLSDKLLKNCNEIIQSLAGKYLTHIGDTYKELPYSSTQTENEDDYDDYDDYHLDKYEEEPDTVIQEIDDYYQNYYENWVNMKIPALGNLTPVQASKTEKGRAMLKEVLRRIENELARSNEKNTYPFPIEKINKRLGL
ncbi:MAG: hypothetical protein WCC17_24685, partial [Candidatus Nitrosopolaris sp.]